MNAEEWVSLDALTGLDSAIISGFLALSGARRDDCVAAYAARYGDAAGRWLQRAGPLWASQRLGVSRVTLARLFGLLPEFMSEPEQLDFARSIWRSATPPTQARLRVPCGYRNVAELNNLVVQHFHSVLPVGAELPEALRSDRSWLRGPAIAAQLEVLNTLMMAERDRLLTLIESQLQVLFARPRHDVHIRTELAIADHRLLLATEEGIARPRLILAGPAPKKTTPIDSRAPSSALVGASIGGGIALLAWLVFSILQ